MSEDIQSTNVADIVLKASALMEDANRLLKTGPLSFYLREMAEAHQYLVNRFSPFREGDRVILRGAPVIDETTRPGWMGCRHFLVKGAVGTIHGVRCDGKGFRYDVVFDKESYKDSKGELHPADPDNRHRFSMPEAWLSKLPMDGVAWDTFVGSGASPALRASLRGQ